MRSLFQKVLIFAVVMLLVAAGGWVGRKAYRRATQRRLLDEAGDCLAKNDYKEANLCLRRAIQINPYGVEAHRMMANMLDSLDSPTALDWRESVVTLQPNNATNRFQWAQTALKFKDYQVAATALRGADEKARQTEDFHKLAGALDWNVGLVSEAETNYLEAFRLDPTNRVIALNLATVHLASTNREVANAARATLAAVPTNSPLWTVAVHQLLNDAMTRKRLAQAVDYSEAIVESPSVNFGDKIEHLELLRLAKDPRYAPWFLSMKAEAGQSPRSAYGLGQWMIHVEGASQTLDWLRSLPPEIQTNQPVPRLIADCLISTKDWKGVLALTESQDWEEIDYYRFALESYAENNLGQKYIAENSWHKALHAASHQLTRLAPLSDVTGRWGWTDHRLEVLSEIMDEFPNEKWASNQYEGELYRAGRTKDLGEFFAKLYAKNPDDARLKNNLANLYLLQNADPENSHRLAKEAYNTATNDPSFSTTYAYSLFLQGRTDEALSVLNGIKPDYLRNPSIAAYYGYIEAKSGHKDRARVPLQTAAGAKLLPEEMEMVRTAQATL